MIIGLTLKTKLPFKKSHTSLRQVNEVGGKKLHERHKIMLQEIESSNFLQAKVKDQLFIDHLLLHDCIDVNQHKNAEHIAFLASSAGCFPSGPSFGMVYQGGASRKDLLSAPLVRLARKLRHVERKWGRTGINLVTDHVVLDKWTEDDQRIAALGEILEK